MKSLRDTIMELYIRQLVIFVCKSAEMAGREDRLILETSCSH